jgi:primosomal protein N''
MIFFWNRWYRIDQTVLRMHETVLNLRRELKLMSEAVDKLKSAVEANTSATQSVVTLVQTMAQQIKDAASTGDLAQVNTLADNLMANTTAIAAAVTANTPAANA